jgi:Xaa-Pro aminopeptidase
MSARMPKSVGTAIGLEIRDNTQSLSSQSSVVLKAGMAFSITLGKHAWLICVPHSLPTVPFV